MARLSRCALLGLAGLVALAACQRRREIPAVALAPGEVPVVRAPIAIDGELHEADWNTLARVAVFTAGGAEARPYSQIRLLRDARTLYVGLYAADQDIRSTDAFELAIDPTGEDPRPAGRAVGVPTPRDTASPIGPLALAIDARGRIAPPLAGARAAADVDETIDDPRDEDEEWVLEVAIPIAAVPPGATAIRAARCDTPKDGVRRCGSWDGPLALPPKAGS